MEWRIYYGDGSTFDSDDGSPTDAPSLDVQGIVYPDADTGRSMRCGRDFYWYENGRWIGGDVFGLWDFLQRTGLVKFGRTIGDAAYSAVVDRMNADPDFPVRSAYRTDDRPPGG